MLKEFLQLPLRLSATADKQEDRNQLLYNVEHNGIFNGYSETRINKANQQFKIKGRILWKVIDYTKKQIATAALIYK